MLEVILKNKILSSYMDIEYHNVGLLHGKMGPCLALYLLNKKYKMPDAEKIADELLSDIVSGLTNVDQIGFDYGLSGIGWGINLLHEYDCAEGEIDEILFEIDAFLYRKVNSYEFEQLNSYPRKIIDVWLYFIARLENPNHSIHSNLHRIDIAAIRNIVNKVYETAPSHFENMSKDLHVNILWDYPLLVYLMAKTYDIGIFREKIASIINIWEHHFWRSIPYNNINRISLALSLLFINIRIRNSGIEEYVRLLYSSINTKKILREIDYSITNIKDGWLYILFLLYKNIKILGQDDIKVSLMECQEMIIKKILISGGIESRIERLPPTFIDGISGIAYMYVRYSEVLDGLCI